MFMGSGGGLRFVSGAAFTACIGLERRAGGGVRQLVLTCGANDVGQLGLGATADHSTPIPPSTSTPFENKAEIL